VSAAVYARLKNPALRQSEANQRAPVNGRGPKASAELLIFTVGGKSTITFLIIKTRRQANSAGSL
jgi:hypothetical protein